VSSSNIARLLRERELLKRHFPLVTPVNDPPAMYQGLCKLEKGYAKEYAERGVWPFTEYVQVMHRFRLELEGFPEKPPVATWLTPISHPNIVPFVREAVCVSTLGKKWVPSTTLCLVVESLFFLLANPNPLNPWNNEICLKAANAVSQYGEVRKQAEQDVFYLLPPEARPAGRPPDVVRFNILDLPKPASSDVVRFSIPRHKAKGRSDENHG